MQCSNYCTIALISNASKVMLKILQARLQQYMNCELPDVPAGFRKGRETRDQIANIRWIIEKAREFQKNIYFCFIDHAKAFDCVDHDKLWKILKEMGIPDHLTCFLRNLYAGQEATVRTGHGTTDWFQIGKGVRQGCTLEGDRDFGELCGSHQGCQGPFRPPIPNVGLLLRRCFPNLEPVCCSMSGSVSSSPAYRFLKRQIRWSGIPIS